MSQDTGSVYVMPETWGGGAVWGSAESITNLVDHLEALEQSVMNLSKALAWYGGMSGFDLPSDPAHTERIMQARWYAKSLPALLEARKVLGEDLPEREDSSRLDKI